MTARHSGRPTGTPHDPHADPARLAARLESILTEHETLYGRLDELSAQQSTLIDEENTDRLLGVLAERQRVVDRLLVVGEELKPFQARWDDLLDQVDGERRETLRSKVASIQDAAKRVNDRDERDRARLAAQRKSLADEIAGVSRSRGALNAYGGKGASGPRYQDRQG
ncbi:MAG: flagellar export chaperone FlgN [Phycisphaerales bacterium]